MHDLGVLSGRTMTHARWKSKRLLAVVSFPSKRSVRPEENTARRVPLTLKNIHAKVQKSTYKENNNENKFMRLENSSPLPRNFSNGPSLNILIDSLSKGGIKCSNMFLLCNWMFSQYSSPISTSTRKMEKSWHLIWFSALDYFLYRHGVEDTV